MRSTSRQDTHPLHRQELNKENQYVEGRRSRVTNIVCSVGVFVDATKERGRGVFANHLHQEVATTGVIVHKSRKIVDEAGYENKGTLY